MIVTLFSGQVICDNFFFLDFSRNQPIRIDLAIEVEEVEVKAEAGVLTGTMIEVMTEGMNQEGMSNTFYIYRNPARFCPYRTEPATPKFPDF